MKKIVILSVLSLLSTIVFGQSAQSVLDKAAATVNLKEGVTANYKMQGSRGNTSGTIAIKGRKFFATSGVADIWFDGTTQWTYMKGNDEVNVTTPTESQLQLINPYNFITLYKKGYASTMNTTANQYIVHLTATQKDQRIKELFVTIDKTTYHPVQIRLLQNAKWIQFDISGLKKANLQDSQFRFNAKDFPQAEIIDLR